MSSSYLLILFMSLLCCNDGVDEVFDRRPDIGEDGGMLRGGGLLRVWDLQEKLLGASEGVGVIH